jgi:Flp pilus assembly protein TadG
MAIKLARTRYQVPPGAAVIGRFLADRGGSPAVEFGLLAPVLMVLLFGTIDLGALTYQSMQVAAAAHAGADYAMHSGWSSSGIQTAVTSATPFTVTASPAPTLTLGCITSGALVVANNATCPSGQPAGNYVTVSAQAAFTPIIAWSAFGLPSTLSAQATVRVS